MSASATIGLFVGTYRADADHSSVGFAVRHMSVATFRGSFSDVAASVAVADDGSLRLSGSVQVRSISIVSPPEFRNHVLGADFLDAGRHPVITFRSDPAPLGEDGSIAVDGQLTIRNVTRGVVATGTWSAPVEDRYGNMRAGIRLTTTVDRRDYGMTWDAPLPKGGDVLGTQVTVTVDLELVGHEGR
jgi:polyisoprenoid-binding protein YceI